MCKYYTISACNLLSLIDLPESERPGSVELIVMESD